MSPTRPEDWLDVLSKRLEAKRRSAWAQTAEGTVWVPGTDLLWNYFEGEPPLPVGADAEARAAYQAFQRQSRTNFAELVVEAVRDRMQPLGFRTGADGDETGDRAAWRVWQANGLDADSATAHRYMLACREAFAIVGDVDPDTDEPLVTIEDPRQAIVAWDPENRRRLRAGLKWWVDEDGKVERARLFWREGAGCAVRAAVRPRRTAAFTGGAAWSWDGEPRQLPVRRLPMVRFVARPDAHGRGRSEFEGVIDIIDRINTQVLSRLVTVAMQTFRQRALELPDGVDLPEFDEAGERIDYENVFESTPAALWKLPAGIKIWESSLTDLQPILQSVKSDIDALAAVSRTPVHYLNPEGANQSAEGAQLAREGRTAKVRDRCATAGEAWQQVMSLAFEWKRDAARASLVDMQMMWQSPEQYTLSERAQAVSQIGDKLPWRGLMEYVLQLSPQEIGRYEQERASDLLLSPDLAPPTAAPAAPAAQPQQAAAGG